MKIKSKKIISIFLSFAMLVSLMPAMNTVASDNEYTELKFGDFGVSEGNIDLGDNIVDLYSLTDASKVTTLDKVAISGKVNFNGKERKWMTFGGTNDVKHAGFWLGAVQENGWAMACQGIGGDGYGDTTQWTEGAKFNSEVELRVTFDKTDDQNTWTVRTYADRTLIGTWTYENVTPGLYIGIPRSMTVDMSTSSTETVEYTEMKFSDWSVLKGVSSDTGAMKDIYALPEDSELTSLDKVAISGKINFNGEEKDWFTFGGTDEAMHGGFWLGAVQENGWAMACQGIGTACGDEISWKEGAKFKDEFTLRITFDKETDKDNWTVKAYADDVLVGIWTYEGVTPGLYIGIPQSATVDMGNDSGNQEPDDTYTEMKFSDWKNYEETTDVIGNQINIYSLSDDSKLKSLDKVSVSGKINFNGKVKNWLTIGGTGDVKYGGFWLGAVQENGWAMACQGIGTAYGDTISWKEGAKFNEEVTLKITFDKETDKNNWTIKVYADDVLIGTWTYENVTPGLYLGIPASATIDMPKVPEKRTYKEMKFSDWSVYEGTSTETGTAMNIFSLPEDTDTKTLDGVAISGKVNFKGNVRNWISIGGVSDVKYAGFWLGAIQENGWAMACQGIGTGYGESIKWSESAKFEKDVNLRITFDNDKDKNSWKVSVYADEVLVGTWTYENVTPGLYIGVPQSITLDTAKLPEKTVYKEMKFSDWSVKEETINDFTVFSLKKSKKIKSLDKIAISGKVNFNGNSRKWIAIGGNSENKNGGFWIGGLQENGWAVVPQGIGGNYLENYIWNERAKFDSTVTLRLTFDKDKKKNSWTVGVYADGVMLTSLVYKGVNPGTYISVEDGVSVEGIDSSIPKAKVPNFSEKYTELKFSDFGMYNGQVENMDIYSLKGHDDIESFDGVAISGKVNFKNKILGKIAVGGTDILKHAGFWLFNDGECLRLSPQGIGADGIDHHVLWAEAWAPLKNKEITLRMTFNKDSKTNEWWVGIYINGEKIDSYNCGVVTPGLYLGIEPKIRVEGLGNVVKNSGLDFTLFGYSNKNWKKEMGLK